MVKEGEPDVDKNLEEGLPADFVEPPPAPVVDTQELGNWSFYRAVIAEFVATLFFLYVALTALIGATRAADATAGSGIGILGTAWAFGAMIFVLVYCTAGVSGTLIQFNSQFKQLLVSCINPHSQFLVIQRHN